MFDPTLPANDSPLVSAEMRGQLIGLKDLIEAAQSVTSVQVDGVDTLNPGENATVDVSFDGTNVHFQFAIPRGENGGNGNDGAAGADGAPGEVTNTDLSAAISGTSSSSNGVNVLGLVASDPPTQSEVQQIADKLDELLNALRR